jgi:hypothetical protein
LYIILKLPYCVVSINGNLNPPARVLAKPTGLSFRKSSYSRYDILKESTAPIVLVSSTGDIHFESYTGIVYPKVLCEFHQSLQVNTLFDMGTSGFFLRDHD